MNRPPASGPITVATPKTAPTPPWYLPRSRSGITSAISAVAVTRSPPAPTPCTARIEMSQSMFCARPHSSEPMTKISALSWKMRLRPNRSPNLPTIAAAIVSASRYAVTTQDRCPAPPRSPTIVGSAVATMVWSSAASRRPSRIVPKMTLICRRESSGGRVAVSTAMDVSVRTE